MKHVPNALTIFRIVLTPILLVLLVSGTFAGSVAAFVLFVIAAVSDYFDGKLARLFKARSRLGQYLDPFADKVLVLGTFVTLAVLMPRLVPWWAVLLIAARDLMVTGLRTWAEARGRSLQTTPLAKFKTTSQLVFLLLTLFLLAVSKTSGGLGLAALRFLESPVMFGLLVFVVLFTVYTGVVYLWHLEDAAPI